MQNNFDFSSLTAQKKTIRELLESFRVTLSHRLDGHDPRVYEMMKYIHLHLFRKSLSVQEIKEACRCWNNNIVTLFKQELEADIRHYIAGMRLDAAAYVMRRKKVTISLLAASVGYTEEPFWRDFKAKYDSTPLQFTRANCEELRSEQTVKMLSQDKKARQGIRGKQTVPHYLWRSSNETVRPLRRVRIVKHHWLQRQSSR